jgi:hypothetical protein
MDLGRTFHQSDMWHLAVIVTAGMAWQLFSNGPLAFYISSALLIVYLCALLAWKSPLWPIFLYGGLMSLMTAGCGAMFATRADGAKFLCDAGSGAPVSLISGLGAIFLIGFMLARSKK